MIQTYYSIRTVKAKNTAEAIKKVRDEKFDEQDDLCDSVITLKSLLIQLIKRIKI